MDLEKRRELVHSSVTLDELDVRRSAMSYVVERSDAAGGVITRTELNSFRYAGQQLKLIDQSRGIRNPRELVATLSILSQPKGPYDDDLDPEDGLLRSAYRDQASDAGDNRKLREAARLQLPVILLQGIAPGAFVPRCPVYVVDDDPVGRFVKLAVDESLRFLNPNTTTDDQRRYAERLVNLRLHQPVFRARVIRAYDTACAVCRLRHPDLLDAAHILGDADSGQPVVSNGLALCKIHHAAYDRKILGVRPDYRVQLREDVLAEVDGPMLRYGLQEMHGRTLHLPSRTQDLPDRDALAQRWEAFTAP